MITSLLHVRGKAPIPPVLLFYSQIHNLSEENQSFDIYIQGKIHKITPQVIAELLGLDRPLKPVSFPPDNEDELVVSKDEFRNAVYLPEHVNSNGRCPKTEIKVAHLKPIITVLVRICQSNILPKFNHHYCTNLSSIYLSYLLLNGYQVDIPYVIWHNMSTVAPNSVRTKAVPYGILVGRLLSQLGHSFPADTPCTSVPADLDVKLLWRNHLPYDPCESSGRPLSEPHSDYISPPPPPPSTDDDDASELPMTLPSDAPREFLCLSKSMQSLKDTMEVILSHIVTRQDRFEKQQQEISDYIGRQDDRFKQQQQEFMQQKSMIEHIAHQQDRLQQQHEEFGRQQKLITDGIVTRQDHFEKQQQETIGRISRQDDRLEQQLQEMIDRIASQDDRLEQQHQEFMQQKKLIEHIAHQQHHLQQQHEEFGQQKKLIDHIVTRQDRFEQQQQEIIDRIAREDDRREQQHQEFVQLRKMIEHIASQQDCLELPLEEFKQQRMIIDHFVTQQDTREQQNRKMIGSDSRKHDRLARRQDQHPALLLQYAQRAFRDQVNPIFQECGNSGYAELLIYCILCQTSAEHSYCIGGIPKNGENETIWTCEDCKQTAELESQQGLQVTS
ncbi:hypothetical protein MKW92_003912 [Papaver armeniacum]|nr:hypothetical protein MKW92_003912 [Papaver armeniacum]